MTGLLITNIGELTTNVDVPGDPCGTITDGALLIADSHGIQFLVRDHLALNASSRKILDRFL